MLEKYSVAEIICFISIVGTAILRIAGFNQLKKKTSTKEGREYIATRGGYGIISLDLSIFLSVITMVLVSVFKLNVVVTIVIQIIVWTFAIYSGRKIVISR
ncbi:MAG: hypothetical protein RR515_01980 [Clostridium sp.]